MVISLAVGDDQMKGFGLQEAKHDRAVDDQAARAERRDRKSTRLNSSHLRLSRMPSSA